MPAQPGAGTPRRTRAAATTAMGSRCVFDRPGQWGAEVDVDLRSLEKAAAMGCGQS